jgi:hypothetical protein
MVWKSVANIEEIETPLQISGQILVLSVISTVATICVVLLALYLIRTSVFTNDPDENQTRIPNDSSELFLLLKDWKPEECKTLLSSFFLQDEYLVLEQLLSALEGDGLSPSTSDGELRIIGDGGWRNRNQIATQTGLSKRRAYGRNGIIDRLVELHLIEERENPRPWGHQTYQYRANITHPLVRSMFHALIGP